VKAPGGRGFTALRLRMVEEQLKPRGISDPDVIRAMLKVPRHLFVKPSQRASAYDDCALPIGPDQSISQPYIVGLMLQALELSRHDRVLEIGTGSGYGAALLAELVAEVYSLEIDPSLSEKSRKLLSRLGYKNAHCIHGDGFLGLPEEGPFDRIVLSAAPQNIPRALLRQLKSGGRMVLPVGVEAQVLVLLEKTPEGLKSSELGMVRFVKMKGEG